MIAKSIDAFTLSEYFNATITADSRRERARKEVKGWKKVKEDKGKKAIAKAKEEEKEKKEKLFVACSESLQRRKSSQGNIVFFEEYTLSPMLRSIQSKVCHPEIQHAASSQIRPVPRPSSLPLSSSSLFSFSLCSVTFFLSPPFLCIPVLQHFCIPIPFLQLPGQLKTYHLIPLQP